MLGVNGPCKQLDAAYLQLKDSRVRRMDDAAPMLHVVNR